MIPPSFPTPPKKKKKVAVISVSHHVNYQVKWATTTRASTNFPLFPEEKKKRKGKKKKNFLLRPPSPNPPVVGRGGDTTTTTTTTRASDKLSPVSRGKEKRKKRKEKNFSYAHPLRTPRVVGRGDYLFLTVPIWWELYPAELVETTYHANSINEKGPDAWVKIKTWNVNYRKFIRKNNQNIQKKHTMPKNQLPDIAATSQQKKPKKNKKKKKRHRR